MCQILLRPSEEVIHHQNLITLFKQFLGKVRAQKSSSTGDEDFVIQRNSLLFLLWKHQAR